MTRGEPVVARTYRLDFGVSSVVTRYVFVRPDHRRLGSWWPPVLDALEALAETAEWEAVPSRPDERMARFAGADIPAVVAVLATPSERLEVEHPVLHRALRRHARSVAVRIFEHPPTQPADH